MDKLLIAGFSALWSKYFPGADLPLAFFYSSDQAGAELVPGADGHRCMIGDLAKARKGQAICFNTVGAVCGGAKRYLGFSQELQPGFEFFLSCGIPGKLEGERYKKTPELVTELMQKAPKFVAPAPYAVFKRWDLLTEEDNPALVIFFATPDVLSGLFTLAGFDSAEPQAVIAPFAAGCGSLIQNAYLELDRESPRAVLGMFDVSARPYVQPGLLSFSVPLPLFVRMVGNMDESFLITPSWQKVQHRIAAT